MKKITLSLLLIACTFYSYSQDFEFGKATHNDNEFDRKKIDSSANAIVIKEFGTSRMQLDDATGYLNIIFEYHTKIKIYNKDGFDAANILIPVYKSGEKEELVSGIKASTFNFDAGKIDETVMDRKAIFTENKNKYRSFIKFTLPNIKEGSVIEYSYTLQSPFLFNYKEWHFQGQFPKAHSEYVAFIPANYNYNVVLRGFQKLSDQKSEVSRECLRLSGVSIDCSKLTYVMNNVPAFIEEDYMTAPSNFISAMYFELSDVQYVNGSKQSYTKNWKDVDYELISDKKFGSQMKQKSAFKDILPVILKPDMDSLAKANAVYNYVKKQVRWNNFYGQYCESTVKDVLDNRTGNVGDVNLTLVAGLYAAGFDAEAIILSTRENGVINKLFPVLSEFNYVIAKVVIGNKSYMLDATDQFLPFGMLPLRCLNDQGRVVSLSSKKASYWIDLKAEVKRTTNYFLDGELTKEGNIKGFINISNYGYSGYNKRLDIKKNNSIEEYVEKLDERLSGIKILSHEIKNVDDLTLPVIERYEVEIDGKQNGNDNLVSLNPFLINPIRKNPFNLNDRVYPVDMGSASDERINIRITLPGDFTVKEQPKDLAIGLPSNSGKYLLQTSLLDRTLTISQVLQLNKPIYQSDEYLYLKEFYSRIIQNQKTDLLIQKTN